jgi:hypothetical protein
MAIMKKVHRVRVIVVSESDDADGNTVQHQTFELVEGCSSPQELCWKAPKIAKAVTDGLEQCMGGMATQAIEAMNSENPSTPWD